MTPSKKEAPILTADQLIAADDRAEKTIDVPEWGGRIRLKALNAGQWRDARERAKRPDGELDEQLYNAHFLMEALVEPKLSADQLGQLMNKNALVLMRVASEALALTGLLGAEKQAARFREGAGEDVGVPDSEPAGDDREPAAEGDAGG